MLNASYCRCKALLKLSKNTLNIDLAHKIDLRCYTANVIYSSESPHKQEYKTENSSAQEQTFTNKSRQQKPYRKEYGHRNNSYKAQNRQENNVTKNEKIKSEPFKIFDTNYAFLDNTTKVVIKPKSPHEDEHSDNTKKNKIYRKNYSVKDNPFYLTKLSYEQGNTVNEDIHFNSQQVDNNFEDHSTSKSSWKLRKKYSFDSNLTFEEDTSINSPLNVDIISNSTQNNIIEDTVNTTNVNSSTDFNLNTGNLRPRLKVVDTPEGQITLNLADDEFDISNFIKEFNEKIPGPLEECTEDISYYGSDFPATFNFAAYADKSKLIQQYIKLGVKLYKLEKNMDHMRALLSVDLEKELTIYIQFLHDCGIPADCLGDAITANPMILKENLDDMKTRIRYLIAHKFTKEEIARIITKNPSWLVWATKYIDERLGHFQNEFKLSGPEMRYLATKAPKLITYPMRHINTNTFAVREQMGFNNLEIKILILSKPRLWMNCRRKIVDSFDYLHNTMNLSHVIIASQADVLTTRKSRLKSRHEFLVELKKAQYDPKKPGYIAPKTMVLGSDAEFCTNVAKTAVDTYNLFLKTR